MIQFRNFIVHLDVVEIDYFYGAHDKERQAIEKLAAMYNQTHANVNIIVSTDFDRSANMDRLAELSNRFDCFTTFPFNLETHGLENLLSLNPLLETEGEQFIEDFDPALMDVFYYQGEFYGLPAFSDVPVMAFNVDLLTKRGVRPPTNDWTSADFIEMINTATSTRDINRSYGFLFNPLDDLLLAVRGTYWADLSTGPPVPKFDSPEFASTLDWIDSLNRAGVLLVQQDYETSRQAIWAGQVAFWVITLDDPADQLIGERYPFEIKIAPMPLMESVQRMFTWGMQGHFVSSKTKDRKKSHAVYRPNVSWR